MKFHIYPFIAGGPSVNSGFYKNKERPPLPKELLQEHGIEIYNSSQHGYMSIDIDARQLYSLLSDQRVEILIHRYREPKKGWSEEERARGLHDHSLLSFDYPGMRFGQR